MNDLRKRFCVIFLIAAIFSTSLPNVNAIPMFYGGGFGTQGQWRRLLNTSTSIFWSQGDFQHNSWEGEDINQLADQGIRINYRFGLWHKFENGEIAWNKSVVDLYYNSSLMELMKREIDWQLSHLDVEKIWAVTLSEEEPMHAYYHFMSQKSFELYNDTYHSEKGFWLRWKDTGVYFETSSEEPVMADWLSEKFIWVFNQLYDHIKGRWPHLQVFQFTGPWPAAPPVFVGGINVNDLKADAYMADLYYYSVYDNPFWLYEFVRHHKSTFPDKELHIHLWGVEDFPTEQEDGFEHMRRNAWVAYLAGVDAIGWFVWHHLYGHVWERDDAFAKRLYVYTNRLNNELSKLPPMKPRSQVLVIRDQMMSVQVGISVDLGLLNEWDVVNQRTFAGEMDLSQYKLIISNEDRYLDGVVEKLNEFVESGGNLVLLGGFGWEQSNFYGNATRTSKFLIEEGVSQKHIWGDFEIDISEPNPLGLNLQCGMRSSLLAIPEDGLTENHHPIGEFHILDEDGKPAPVEGHPLVLYHDPSDPLQGSILYWGLPSTYPITGEPDVEDVVEPFLPEYNYIRFLYRNVTRALTRNYLRLNTSITKSGLENMIITQSEIDEGTILAGISNYSPQTVSLNYTLDLDNFDLPEGGYWVHSLDENTTLGHYESEQALLEIPLTISTSGTRLLLISQSQPEPSYSVNVFPGIPTAEEAETLTPPRFRTIMASEAKQIMESTSDITILDVRPVDEYDRGHIKGALNMPMRELEERLGELNRSRRTIVYSRKGVESTHASQTLVDNDFSTVYNMQAGITAWTVDEGYPTTSTSAISITLPTTTIIEGEAVTVTGSLSPQIPGVPVDLTYIKAEDIEEMKTVTSEADGSFTDTHTPEASGSWSVKASWEGNADFEGAASETIHFEVAEASITPNYTIYIVAGGLLLAGAFAAFFFVIRRKKKTDPVEP